MYSLVSKIETRISELNSFIYNTQSDITRIERALSNKIRFNLDEIAKVFSDSKIYFGDQVTQDYTALVEFNTLLTKERNTALRKRLKLLQGDQERFMQERQRLNADRAGHMQIVQSMDTFDKFKLLQRDLAEQKAELVYLENQLEKVRVLAELSLQINAKQRAKGQIVDEIKAMIDGDSPVRARFAALFNQYCKRVLDHDGAFFFKQNSNGNVDYEISLELAGQKGKPSSLDKGNTYKKLLCALFDLALLVTYQETPFFHFVYHDGVLEGVDNRKKIMFLELVQEILSSGKIQYILSAIDSDLPRNQETDAKIAVTEDEVILALHDDGNDGRLFKMAEF